MPTNYTNNKYDVITGLQTVPKSVNATGTISTQGSSVIGVGTKFTEEMPKGSWLTSLGANELRKVMTVQSDTLAYLDHGFTVDLSSVTPNVIANIDTHVCTISLQIKSGLADGLIFDKVFPSGTSITLSKDSRDKSGTFDFIDPVIVDATSTSMQIVTLK